MLMACMSVKKHPNLFSLLSHDPERASLAYPQPLYVTSAVKSMARFSIMIRFAGIV